MPAVRGSLPDEVVSRLRDTAVDWSLAVRLIAGKSSRRYDGFQCCVGSDNHTYLRMTQLYLSAYNDRPVVHKTVC